MKGCTHNPEAACHLCVKAMAEGNAIFIDTPLKPAPGESLANFMKRVDAERVAVEPGPIPEEFAVPQKIGVIGSNGELLPDPGWTPPSIEEQKRLIRDPDTPPAIRKYWREKLYGPGETDRRAVMQAHWQKQLVPTPVRSHTVENDRLRGLSGRQKKIMRRLVNRTRRVLGEAAGI
jgi:hypothetical protein